MSQDAKEMLKKQMENLKAVRAAAIKAGGSTLTTVEGQAPEATSQAPAQTSTPAPGTPGQTPKSTT